MGRCRRIRELPFQFGEEGTLAGGSDISAWAFAAKAGYTLPTPMKIRVGAEYDFATGQDPAHIVEGSLGVTTAEVEPNGNLYFSIYLPALIIGTVGGGTSLPTQKEALAILAAGGTTGRVPSARSSTISNLNSIRASKRASTDGKESRDRPRLITGDEFAKVIAAAVLAGELSLTASLAEGSLARAHKRLGRRHSEINRNK